MRIILTIVAIVAVFGGVLGYILLSETPVTEQTLEEAETALKQGEQETALRLAKRYIAKYPSSPKGHLIAGNAHAQMNEIDKAYECYSQALTDENHRLAETHLLCAKLAVKLCRVPQAETHYRKVLDLQPRTADAMAGLFRLYRLQGRNREIIDYFQAVIRAGAIDNTALLILARPDYAHLKPDDGDYVNACMEAMPDDPLPMLGQARNMLAGIEPGGAVNILNGVIEKHPRILLAHGLLGEALLRMGTVSQLKDWVEKLPENKDESPEIWCVRGELAERNNDLKGAARCYWEGLKREVVHRPSAYRLAMTLLRIEEKREHAEVFAQHAQELIETGLLAFQTGTGAPENYKKMVARMRKQGRVWEAAGWCYAATRVEAVADWARLESTSVIEQLRAEPPFVLAGSNPAESIDLSEWPIPELGMDSIKTSRDFEKKIIPPSGLGFRDDAKSKGLEFLFNNAISTQARIFEFSGGGASVADFDRDGWPDIYFTQGADWPVDPDELGSLDQLFRNRGETGFENVTAAAMHADNRYSQGAAVGDLDNDGFADIYVTNIGANAFYHNNGDGTFTEVELDEAIAGKEWTIDAVLADVTGDGVPDIYNVNYLGGDDLFTRACRSNGVPRRCHPALFSAEPDKLFVGDGAGALHDQTADLGLSVAGGKGMSAVVFRTAGASHNSIFVSNEEADFFFDRQGDGYREVGLLQGLALGADGAMQSGRGASVGDVDNDGRADVFVANDAGQINNLFSQTVPGHFTDRVRDGGLWASHGLMGWGSQFIDGDLDGNLDLVVANGHFEDRSAMKVKSAMAAQYFHNFGGWFAPAPYQAVGDYFKHERFGRAVARLDWNRDGLPDLVMTHTFDAAALLTNIATRHGQAIRVHPVGTTCSRDAVGTVLRLTTDKRTLTRQISAGDGFQATNQNLILFGIADDEVVKSLTVTWADGAEESFSPTPNQDWVMVQGSGTLRELPK